MVDSLAVKEASLVALRRTRDFGTTILVAGIVVEIIIEALWIERAVATDVLKDPHPTWPFESWHIPFFTWKGIALFLAGMVAVAGIYIEQTYGKQVDDVTDEIRSIQREEIGDAENRADAASKSADTSSERAIRLLRIESDRHVIVYSDAFDKLRTFNNISVWVQIAAPRLSDFANRPNVEPSQIAEKIIEQEDFAATFNRFKAIGWNVTVLSEYDPRAVYMPAGPDSIAVHIHSRGPNDMYVCDNDPYAVELSTPEMNECAAAGALAGYLRLIGAGPATHWPLESSPLETPKEMPVGTILVMVGSHDVPAALEEEERSIELNKLGLSP